MAYKQYIYSVHDMNKNKLCVLFDSSAQQEGEARDISIKKEMNGWKETSFNIPMFLNDGTPNYRVDFIKPEHLLRVLVDGEPDWYVIQEPTQQHDGLKATLSVQCNHISANLKTKALYIEFNDENGIDTCANLATKILAGTGWSLGECDTFYEPDGTTERVRSFNASTKRGAYNLISDLCELFVAYPTYHGETKRVDIHARSNKTGLTEITFGKNTSSIKRKQNSEDIVTRLYVEGEYGDFGYVGIDDAVPSNEVDEWKSSYVGSDGLLYTVDNGEATITGYIPMESTLQDLIIPPFFKLNGVDYPVTKIDNGVFQNKTNLMSITCPDSITNLGNNTTYSGSGALEKTDGSRLLLIYSNGVSSYTGYTSNVYIMPNHNNVSFILNFNYFNDMNVFTDTQKEAAVKYYNMARYYTKYIYRQSQAMQSLKTELSQFWGTNWYVIYRNGSPIVYGNGATVEDGVIKINDQIYLFNYLDGTYEYVTVESLPYTPPSGRYVIKFGAPVFGTMGSYEDAITAATQSLTEYTDKRDEQDQGSEEYKYYDNLITETQTRIDGLYDRFKPQMLNAYINAEEIDMYEKQIAQLQNAMTENEQEFSEAVGEMLRDGYWSDTNFIPGQEQALYNDALKISKEMAYPRIEYSCTLQNISDMYELSPEYFDINETFRVYDEVTGIHDYAFVQTVSEFPDNQKANNISISTDELNIGNKTLTSLLNRITETADLIKRDSSIFERARSIGFDGSIGMDVLNGEIDVLAHKLASAASNWYTDENGNLVFISSDNTSAMMLTGQGFMVADGHDTNGNWKWRTFGTGKGFTADMMTTGILRAAYVTILGSNKFYWDSENICIFPDANDLYKQIRIGNYDLNGSYGIGFTLDDGQTWQNAIGYDGVHFSVGNINEMQEMINATIDPLATQLDTFLSSTWTQTQEAITSEFRRVDGRIDNQIQTLETYIRFDSNGITIGKKENGVESPFVSKFTNTELGFYQDNQRVAYISNQKMYITKAEITDTLTVGNPTNQYLDIVSKSDGVGFVWRNA